MEQEGIFWFFTHQKVKLTLVLSDDNSAFPPIQVRKRSSTRQRRAVSGKPEPFVRQSCIC
ncbi:phage late control D family protein [Kluyvera genomosp. 2]|uniref:phage late control D family protein n=1 Tax=Kluyvera genomosp. 2 TaxID=2774054 RepID=UPI002158DE65|nr:phage late control D family protein [Kluyvera genomosp. 2]